MKRYTLIILVFIVNICHAQLVGKWTFNEYTGTIAYDSSGNNLNGTLMNSVKYVTSPGTDAVSLNGSNYATFGSNSLLNIRGAYTIEAWANIKSSVGYPMLLGKVYHMYGIEVSAGGNLYLYGGATGNNYVAAPWEANVWHHYVGVSDPSLGTDNLKIYIDGVLVSSRTTPHAIPDDGTGVNLNAGMQQGGDAGWLTADIDELALYDTALSASEVAARFNAGVTKYPIQTCNDAWSHGYGLPADLNHDCKINFQDLAEMASLWLQCNDPTKQECEQ